MFTCTCNWSVLYEKDFQFQFFSLFFVRVQWCTLPWATSAIPDLKKNMLQKNVCPTTFRKVSCFNLTIVCLIRCWNVAGFPWDSSNILPISMPHTSPVINFIFQFNPRIRKGLKFKVNSDLVSSQDFSGLCLVYHRPVTSTAFQSIEFLFKSIYPAISCGWYAARPSRVPFQAWYLTGPTPWLSKGGQVIILTCTME